MFITKSHKGFSILIALGTIWVLLILVTWLTITYIREIQLSRTTYDEIIANMSAEGIFEYAMLKIRNHREGFSDSMSSKNVDGKIFLLESERSKNLESEYKIQASATGYLQVLNQNEHLIIPLFSAKELYVDTFGNSKTKFFMMNKSHKLIIYKWPWLTYVDYYINEWRTKYRTYWYRKYN